MCGRYNLTTSASEIADTLGIKTSLLWQESFNIAPSQSVLAARQKADGDREMVFLRWGLIPFFVKDLKKTYKPINAKSETVFEKPFFRGAVKKRRCLIPANGFYEWRPENHVKQPYLIHFRDNHLFFFAGLYEEWQSLDGEIIESCTILTCDANKDVLQVHHRMPVILPANAWDIWLDTSVSEMQPVKDLLKPFDGGPLDIYPVSTDVNSPKNNSPNLVDPL